MPSDKQPKSGLRIRRDKQGRIMYRVHPNGWVIRRRERDRDARGLGGMTADLKVYWEVKKQFSSSRRRETFRTLREAIAWCDEKPAPGS